MANLSIDELVCTEVRKVEGVHAASVDASGTLVVTRTLGYAVERVKTAVQKVLGRLHVEMKVTHTDQKVDPNARHHFEPDENAVDPDLAELFGQLETLPPWNNFPYWHEAYSTFVEGNNRRRAEEVSKARAAQKALLPEEIDINAGSKLITVMEEIPDAPLQEIKSLEQFTAWWRDVLSSEQRDIQMDIYSGRALKRNMETALPIIKQYFTKPEALDTTTVS